MRLVPLSAITALLAGLLTHPAAAACDHQALAAKYPGLTGTHIRVAQDGESPPYSFRDPADFENLIGLDADLTRAAFACLGMPVEFKTGKWSGMLPSVIAGQADLMWNNLYYTPPRAQQVDFVTYLLAATGALVQKGNPKNINALADTCGIRAAAGVGTVEETLLRKTSDACTAEGKAALEIFTYADKPSGLRLVQNNRADLMLTDGGFVGAQAKTQPGAFAQAFSIKTNFKVGPGISKRMPQLRDALDDVLKTLEADGTLQGLMSTYGIDPALMLPVESFTQ